VDLRLIHEGVHFTLYAIETGESVGQFLEELERDDQADSARLIRRLEQLANTGPSAKRNEFNALGNELYEAKTHGGARVVFFYRPASIVICACGFHKQSRKTPRKWIQTALQRKNAYEKEQQTPRRIRVVLSPEQIAPKRLPT